ncbi:glycosyltransferase family 2 protein [Bacteroides fragilis]
MTMLLSIIVPTFKPQKTYFEECLFSLFNQTMFHYLYEVIVVLNGDIDTQYTDMILDIFAYKPAGLYCRLIKTDQAGVSNARNLGIDAAKGQYIGFVDDDDIVSSDYLEELCKISSRNIVGVSNVHTFRKTIEEKEDNFFCLPNYSTKRVSVFFV